MFGFGMLGRAVWEGCELPEQPSKQKCPTGRCELRPGLKRVRETHAQSSTMQLQDICTRSRTCHDLIALSSKTPAKHPLHVQEIDRIWHAWDPITHSRGTIVQPFTVFVVLSDSYRSRRHRIHASCCINEYAVWFRAMFLRHHSRRSWSDSRLG